MSPYPSSCDRACGDLANLLKVLAVIAVLLLAASFLVSFLGGGFIGLIITLIIGCGGLFCLFYQAQ